MTPYQAISAFVYGWIVIIGVIGVRSLRDGYRRRRPHWSRGSWLRFGATSGIGLALALAPAMAEIGRAAGWFSRDGLTRNQLGGWIVAMLIVMCVGAGLLGASLSWFAKGPPEKPFPRWWRRDTLLPRHNLPVTGD